MDTFKKYCFVVVAFVLIFISMCPLSAFASSNSFKWECSEPYVDEHNSYLALNFGNGEGYLYRFSFYPVTNNVGTDTDNDVLDISLMLTGFDRRSNNTTRLSYYVLTNAVVSYYLSVSYITPDGLVYYYPLAVHDGPVSGVLEFDGHKYIHNYTLKGNIYVEGDSNFPIAYSMVPEWGNDSNYHSELSSIINNLFTLHEDNLELINLYIEAVNNLATLHDDNLNLLGKLVEVVDGVVQLHNDNVEILSDFAKLLIDTKNIKSLLDGIYNYLYDDLSVHLFEIEYLMMDTNDKLDTIIELLNGSGESEYSEVDRTGLDKYLEDESRLISRVDVSAAMNIDIDQNAMAFCWNTVENILGTNGKLLVVVFAVLSIGVISLLLGR